MRCFEKGWFVWIVLCDFFFDCCVVCFVCDCVLVTYAASARRGSLV